jgi:DNA-binding transcriptional regulator YdaS (Cro superfamily)
MAKIKTGIERAVALAHGQKPLAQELGVTQQNVSHWCRLGYAPLVYVVAIESLTGVPRRELMRPAFTALFESPEFDKETGE